MVYDAYKGKQGSLEGLVAAFMGRRESGPDVDGRIAVARGFHVGLGGCWSVRGSSLSHSDSIYLVYSGMGVPRSFRILPNEIKALSLEFHDGTVIESARIRPFYERLSAASDAAKNMPNGNAEYKAAQADLILRSLADDITTHPDEYSLKPA